MAPSPSAIPSMACNNLAAFSEVAEEQFIVRLVRGETTEGMTEK